MPVMAARITQIIEQSFTDKQNEMQVNMIILIPFSPFRPFWLPKTDATLEYYRYNQPWWTHLYLWHLQGSTWSWFLSHKKSKCNQCKNPSNNHQQQKRTIPIPRNNHLKKHDGNDLIQPKQKLSASLDPSDLLFHLSNVPSTFERTS